MLAGCHRRRGAGYVYFLSTIMLVAVIGVSALMFARISQRSALGGDSAIAARFFAQSAIELGLAEMHLDPDWRTNRGSGAWFTDKPIGGGTLSLEVSIIKDGDGNPYNDPVLLVGTGVHGHATHRLEVTLGALSEKGGLVASPASVKRHTD
jgi:hypothetical protein